MTKQSWTKAIGKNSEDQVGVLEIQRANYTDREARDNHYLRLKSEGRKHVIKFTTHDGNNRAMIYVVTWSEPAPLTAASKENSQ